ncbi:uncharacterized protein LOC100180371 [Ciona intestinalis]
MQSASGNFSDGYELDTLPHAQPARPWFNREKFDFDSWSAEEPDLMLSGLYKLSLVSKMRIFTIMLFVIVLPSIIVFCICLYKERKRKRSLLMDPIDDRWQTLSEMGLPDALIRKSTQTKMSYEFAHSSRTGSSDRSQPDLGFRSNGEKRVSFPLEEIP